MKRILLLLTVLSFHILSFSQSFVEGGIYNNTTWTLAGSPYIVTGSIVVFPGKTLTIEPGCVVKFIADSSFNIGNFKYLEIRGSLVAIGTPDNPIVFTSTDTTDGFYNWMGIRIKGSQGGSFQLNNFELHNSWYGLHNDISEPGVSCTFSNCLFKKNSYAIQLNADLSYTNCTFEKNSIGQASQIVYGSLTASNCSFIQNFCSFTWSNYINVTDCVFSGNQNNIIGSPGIIQNCSFYDNVNAITESASMEISNCVFENNQIAVDENGGSTISDCQFLNNGVAVKIGENSSVINNTITGNQIGVQVEAYNPVNTFISENQLCNNSLYNLENLTDKNFQVNTNCFCDVDSATIENSIFDGYDDITRGLVNYTIYDLECTSVLRVITKVILEEPTTISNSNDAKSNWKAYSSQNHIEINSEISAELRIHNVAGQLLYSQSIIPGTTFIQVNLDAGVYILSDNKGNWTKLLLNAM